MRRQRRHTYERCKSVRTVTNTVVRVAERKQDDRWERRLLKKIKILPKNVWKDLKTVRKGQTFKHSKVKAEDGRKFK